MEPTSDHDATPAEEAADEPEASAEPDEQVALDRLTAAFAELLGTEGSSTEEEVESEPADDAGESDDSGDSDEVSAEAGDEPATLPLRPPDTAPPIRLEPPQPQPVEPPFPISPRGILEAMLFVGDPENQPLSPKVAAARLRGVSPREIESLVQELNDSYRAEGCPYVIESSGEGYRLVLRSEFASVRERFYGRIREARLSQFAIDVLALVAYHQPITKARVDEIRGKPSGGVLSQLVRRQLLRIERSEGKPRVTKYFTTDRFLDLFALGDLGDLPRTQELDRTV